MTRSKFKTKIFLNYGMKIAGLILLVLVFWQCGNNKMNRNEIDFSDTLSQNAKVVDTNVESVYKNDEESFPYYQQYVILIEDAEKNNNHAESDFHRIALLHLMKAIQEQASFHHIDISHLLEAAEKDADKVTHDVNKTASVQIKSAAEHLTAALKKIQKKKFKSLKASREDLQKTVSNINGMRMIEEEQDEIFDFHKQAVQFLEKMNQRKTQK